MTKAMFIGYNGILKMFCSICCMDLFFSWVTEGLGAVNTGDLSTIYIF